VFIYLFGRNAHIQGKTYMMIKGKHKVNKGERESDLHERRYM